MAALGLDFREHRVESGDRGLEQQPGQDRELEAEPLRVIEIVSYVLIVLVGARLLWVKGHGLLRAWRALKAPPEKPSLCGHAAGHAHASACGHDDHVHHEEPDVLPWGHAHGPEPQELAGPGGWRELCTPAPDGTVAGFPVAGSWTSDRRHLRGSSGFTVTCASGAVGKCVRFGYKPW